YAKRTADRKVSELEALIQRLAEEGKQRVIPMQRGRIDKIKDQLNYQLVRINKKRSEAYTSTEDKGVGIIKVEV
ncbi:MAG TPA: hypothetical protein P5082_10440, partial [Treponema sp.]|nr:hypothetical protein [Treponema sp.]